MQKQVAWIRGRRCKEFMKACIRFRRPFREVARKWEKAGCPPISEKLEAKYKLRRFFAQQKQSGNIEGISTIKPAVLNEIANRLQKSKRRVAILRALLDATPMAGEVFKKVSEEDLEKSTVEDRSAYFAVTSNLAAGCLLLGACTCLASVCGEATLEVVGWIPGSFDNIINFVVQGTGELGGAGIGVSIAVTGIYIKRRFWKVLKEKTVAHLEKIEKMREAIS